MKKCKITVVSAEGVILTVRYEHQDRLSPYRRTLIEEMPEGASKVKVIGASGTRTIIEPL